MNIFIIISVSSFLFCLFFFFYTKWHIKRKISASSLLAEYRTEVYRLIAEIDAATDRDTMLVEDRIKRLKEILNDTDKRISVYVNELEKSRKGETLYTSLGRGIRSALNTTEPIEQKTVNIPETPPVFTVIRNDNKVPASPPAALSKRQIRSQIDALIKEGLSAGEIAMRLGITPAEVDLAMNLMKRK